jgi:hypothetical protein
MDGLGRQVMQQGGQGQGQGNQELIAKVIQLLQQGVSPEELIQNGVPQEVVEQAINILNGKAQQGPTQPQGLGAQAVM